MKGRITAKFNWKMSGFLVSEEGEELFFRFNDTDVNKEKYLWIGNTVEIGTILDEGEKRRRAYNISVRRQLSPKTLMEREMRRDHVYETRKERPRGSAFFWGFYEGSDRWVPVHYDKRRRRWTLLSCAGTDAENMPPSHWRTMTFLPVREVAEWHEEPPAENGWFWVKMKPDAEKLIPAYFNGEWVTVSEKAGVETIKPVHWTWM